MEYNLSKAINNSILSKINPKEGGSPQKFKKVWDEGFQDSGQGFYKLGTLIHRYILEPDKFTVIAVDKVSEKGQIIAYLIWDNMKHSLKSGEVTLDDLMEDVEYLDGLMLQESYQNPNWKMETRREKLVGEVKPYLQELIDNSDKVLISDKELTTIMGAAATLKLNRSTEPYISLENTKTIDVYNETEIFWEDYIGGEMMQLKSKLDKFVVNHDNKTITVIDLKSTGKPVDQFVDSFMNYNYGRQIAYYADAVMWYVENVLKLKDYKLSKYSYILAVETYGVYEARVFAIPNEELTIYREEYIELLGRIQWHINMNEWYYPKGFEQFGGTRGIYILTQ